MNYRDFTLKAVVDNIPELEAILLSLGATFVGTDLQIDHYFKTEAGKLKWREGTIENFITHYERFRSGKMEKTLVYRYDVDPTPVQISALRKLHTQLEEIRKHRKIYFIAETKIHLDTLENGASYAEIEVMDHEGRYADQDLIAICIWIQHLLRIPDSNLIPTGYLQ